MDLHEPRRPEDSRPRGDKRRVELVVNGQVAVSQEVPADNRPHDLTFSVKIDRSSWVALRVLASSHTNPIFVIVGGKPIRASRRSAEWCLKAVDQCWSQKAPKISARERDEAAKAGQLFVPLPQGSFHAGGVVSCCGCTMLMRL